LQQISQSVPPPEKSSPHTARKKIKTQKLKKKFKKGTENTHQVTEYSCKDKIQERRNNPSQNKKEEQERRTRNKTKKEETTPRRTRRKNKKEEQERSQEKSTEQKPTKEAQEKSTTQ
jgi:hypothetical protein